MTVWKARRATDRHQPSSTGKTFIATDIERVPYKTLIPADYNPRKMDARTLRVLMGSLIRFGWVMPVVINRRTGNIVGSHQRATANAEVIRKLRRQKDPRAREYERPPAIFVDVSLTTEKAMNVALNQISGDWDFFKKVAADVAVLAVRVENVFHQVVGHDDNGVHIEHEVRRITAIPPTNACPARLLQG